MTFFQELMANRVLWVVLVAWFTAQAIKVSLDVIIQRKFDWGRFFFGLGGMPSSHSAMVCALAVAVGITEGFNSVLFAVVFVLAGVVMTDAAGVRRAAGQQAEVINKIVKDLFALGRTPTNEILKEFLGHTPFEVIVGGIWGIVVALVMM